MARRNDYIRQIDKIIGKKIFELRLEKGKSREQLAAVIDVTQQQLQKYEKGVNRISAGRLVLIAKALKKPVKYFYEEVDQVNIEPVLTQHQSMCLEISRNFMKIASSKHQAAINDLVKVLSKAEKEVAA